MNSPLHVAVPGQIPDSLRLHPSHRAFRKHILKHVASARERGAWEHVLPVRQAHWQEFLRALSSGAKPDEQGACLACDQYRDAIEKGIAYALGTPVYLKIKETITNWRVSKSRESQWFLGREGLLICGDGRAVVTAFFSVSRANVSRHELYRRGVRFLRARGNTAEARTPRYLDDENLWATAESVEWHVRENFSNATNQWKRPPKPKGPRATARQDYLNFLEDEQEVVLRTLDNGRKTRPKSLDDDHEEGDSHATV